MSTHPDDVIEKYWATDGAGTLHAVLLLAGRAEAFCAAAVQLHPRSAAAPIGAPPCPDCLTIALEAGRRLASRETM